MVVDALGRNVDLPAIPQRIVSLVPSITEYLVYLGLLDRLVGRTKFCVHPAEALQVVPAIGGTKNPDCAAIQALKPDLVLANKEENRKQDVQTLTAAGIPVYVTEINSVGEAIDALTLLARLLHVSRAAQPLLNAIQEEMAHTPMKCSRVAAFIWRNPWMLVGAHTYAGDLLRLAGGSNIANAFNGRYPEIKLEQLSAINLDLILLPDEPYLFGQDHIPEVRALGTQVKLCDGTLLSWYGPRLPLALKTFRELLGPED